VCTTTTTTTATTTTTTTAGRKKNEQRKEEKEDCGLSVIELPLVVVSSSSIAVANEIFPRSSRIWHLFFC